MLPKRLEKVIADYKCFENDPELLMYGCMWVIFSVGVWLFLASYLEMPVSTTHSCVGGMIGMAIALKGTDCVIWYKPVETFPYVGGVGGIVLSWFLSPIFSAIIACCVFSAVRCSVLRRDFNSKRLNFVYPILIGSTITINTFFIIYKGAKGLGLHKTPIEVAFLVAFGAGGLSAIVTIPIVPKIKEYVRKKFQNAGTDIELSNIQEVSKNQHELNIKDKIELDRVVRLHDEAEKFDNKTEEVFKYLQILQLFVIHLVTEQMM